MIDVFMGWLWQGTFYGSVVGGLILLSKRILNKHLNAQWHWLIWLLLLVKLLVPIGPETAFSVFNILPTTEFVAHYASTSPMIDAPQVQNNNATLSDQGNVNIPPSQPMTTESQRNQSLFTIWLLGAVIYSLWLGWCSWRMAQQVKGMSQITEGSIYQSYDQVRQNMAVKGKITVHQQLEGHGPALYGLLKPKILVPVHLLGLAQQQFEHIFAHELMHYRRWDHWMNGLLLVLNGVFWFNPLIWFFFARMRKDMESATDWQVLKQVVSQDHQAYGETLLLMVQQGQPLAPKMLAMADDYQDLKQRLQRIKQAKVWQQKPLRTMVIGGLCVVLLGVGVLTSQGGQSVQPLAKAKTALNYYWGQATSPPADEGDIATQLLREQTAYIGNSSQVGSLLAQLPLGHYRQKMALQTSDLPYGLTVQYDFTGAEQSAEQIQQQLYRNSAVFMILVKNADYVRYEIVNPDGYTSAKATVTLNEVKLLWGGDVWDFATDEEILTEFMNRVNDTDVATICQEKWVNQQPASDLPMKLPATVELNGVYTYVDQDQQQQAISDLTAYNRYIDAVAQGQPAWLDLVEYQLAGSYQPNTNMPIVGINWNRVFYDGQEQVLYHYQLGDDNVFAETYDPGQAHPLAPQWDLEKTMAYGRNISEEAYQP